MLHLTPKAYGSLGHGKRSPQKKATTTYQTKAPLNEALGTLEASNHSSYQKAPLKALLAEEPGGAPPEGTNLERLANKEAKESSQSFRTLVFIAAACAVLTPFSTPGLSNTEPSVASKLTEIVNFGSSTWPINKYCDIRSYPAEAIVVHEPDDTYATSQPSSKARPSVRGVACPPQWLPVLLAADDPPDGLCIEWYGQNCAADGSPSYKPCSAEIYNDETGSCRCSNNEEVAFSCDTSEVGETRPPFTCTLACNDFSQPIQESCTGSRHANECGRHFCNPDGNYSAYYNIPGNPDQGTEEKGTVTKVEVIFDNTQYNSENRYNYDLVKYELISTGCTYDDGKYNGSVKYDKTTGLPIDPPKCSTKLDGEVNSDGEPIKSQNSSFGRFNDTYYGVGKGSLFIPVSSDYRPPNTPSNIFEFHWCPNENTFQVTVFKTGPYQFVHLKPEAVVAGMRAEIDQHETTIAEMQAEIDQLQADKTGTIKVVFV